MEAGNKRRRTALRKKRGGRPNAALSAEAPGSSSTLASGLLGLQGEKEKGNQTSRRMAAPMNAPTTLMADDEELAQKLNHGLRQESILDFSRPGC